MKGHIYWTQNYKGETVYKFEEYDRRSWAKEPNEKPYVWIREHTAEFEVPEEFDPRPAIVADLEAEKVRMRAEFAAKVVEIDKRISQLLALEMA
jgi:hypothetical protein